MSSTLKALSRVEELLRPLDVPNSRYYFLQRLDRLQDLCKAPKKIALKTEMADAEKTKLRTATESLAKEVTAYLTTQQPQWVSVGKFYWAALLFAPSVLSRFLLCGGAYKHVSPGVR